MPERTEQMSIKDAGESESPTMSRKCPLCGAEHRHEGKRLSTLITKRPYGIVGMSFCEACYLADPSRAHILMVRAIKQADAIALVRAAALQPAQGPAN